MDIQGLIFDNDGTLVDTMPAHFLAWQRTFARHGLELSQERFYTMGGTPPWRIAKILSGEQGVEIDVQQSKDGVLVLLHDTDLRRVAGSPADCTYEVVG